MRNNLMSRHAIYIHWPKIRTGFLICLSSVLLIGCGTASKTPIASLDNRNEVLHDEQCAEHFARINSWIDVQADVERGAFQVRQSPDIDRFDVGLFKKWHTRASGAPTYIYSRVIDSNFELFPHIMNYDLMGDFYYCGCTYGGQSVVGRVWHGRREQIDPDPVMAAKHYEFAAIGHVARSQYKLGRMLFEGDGIPRDEEMGIKWLTSAALEGYSSARSYLKRIDVDVPPAISPNTYTLLAKQELAAQQRWQNAIDFRQQQKRESWANFFTVAIVAVGAYYAADAAVSGGLSAGSSQAVRSHSQPQRVVIQRTQPAFCSSTVNITITGGTYASYANGAISTFCY